MINQDLLRKYARTAVRIGSNVQKGQYLVITAPVSAYEFATLCVEEAYLAGAGKVEVRWHHSQITKLSYDYVATDTLKEVPQWSIDQCKYGIDKKCCYLHILSDIPGLLKDVDPEKLQAVNMERHKAMEPFRYYTMNNVGQWSIVAIPNPIWAKKIYPELDEEQGVAKLWEAILKTVHVDAENDPVEAWNKHNAELAKHSKMLNDFNFSALHFTNNIGTDLMVGLAENHIWAGGQDKTTSGVLFNPNLPTEEVFSTPSRSRVNGTVVSSKPLNYQGKLIENFRLTFKDGAVVDFQAEKNEDVLKNLLDLDEGSRHLGEVALISYLSPISQTNLLFYETLFDENASCHLALGAAYPGNVKGGTEMSKDELLKNDVNVSMNHCDFMFGTSDMNVVGIKHDGTQVQIFKDGNFCI